MPTCFCSGCRARSGVDPQTSAALGCEVNARTLKMHKLQDEVDKARRAKMLAAEVVDAEIEEISAHLASATLADKISGNVQSNGLWSRNHTPQDVHSSTISDASSESSPLPPPHPIRDESRRLRVQRFIRELSSLDSSVKTLAHETISQLESLEYPGSCQGSIFPLKYLYHQCSVYQSNLNVITSKEHSVVELKKQIAEQLDQISSSLASASVKWKETQQNLVNQNEGVPHNSSKSVSYV